MTLPNELYAAVLHAAPDAVLVVDDGGRIVFCNHAVQAIFGRSIESLQGQPIEELVPIARRAQHRGHRHAYHADATVRPMGARVDIVGLHRDGTEIPLEVSLSPITTSAGTYVICIARDATERRAMIEQLRELSYRDALTGLYSRTFFEVEMARLDVSRVMPIVCFVFDVDGLKLVNDSRGHAAGDELIRRAANLLYGCFRSEDIVARVGGDEFVALLPSMTGAAAEITAARIQDALANQVPPAGAPRVSLSIGWAVATEPPITEALRSADERMYAAKRAQRAP